MIWIAETLIESRTCTISAFAASARSSVRQSMYTCNYHSSRFNRAIRVPLLLVDSAPSPSPIRFPCCIPWQRPLCPLQIHSPWIVHHWRSPWLSVPSGINNGNDDYNRGAASENKRMEGDSRERERVIWRREGEEPRRVALSGHRLETRESEGVSVNRAVERSAPAKDRARNANKISHN